MKKQSKYYQPSLTKHIDIYSSSTQINFFRLIDLLFVQCQDELSTAPICLSQFPTSSHFEYRHCGMLCMAVAVWTLERKRNCTPVNNRVFSERARGRLQLLSEFSHTNAADIERNSSVPRNTVWKKFQNSLLKDMRATLCGQYEDCSVLE